MNYFKEKAAHLMQSRAADNADAKNIVSVYAIPFLLLLVVSTTAGFFGALFDYEVLNNILGSATKAAAVAAVIHIGIYATGVPIAKMLAYGGDKKHTPILIFLTPLLITFLGLSVFISINTKSAERNNLRTYSAAAAANIERQQDKHSRAAGAITAKIDSAASREAQRLERMKSAELEALDKKTESKKAQFLGMSKKYKNIYTNTKQNWAKALSYSYKIDSTAAAEQRRTKAAADIVARYNFLTHASDSSATAAKKISLSGLKLSAEQLATLSKMDIKNAGLNFNQIGNFKKYRNILFSLLSLIILFGLQIYYKQINTETTAETVATVQTTAAAEIKKLKDRIRVSNERAYSSKTYETRIKNAEKSNLYADKLQEKHGIKTIFNREKTTFK